MPEAKLGFHQYQMRAKATAFYPHAMEGAHPIAMSYAVLKLNGEAGEVAELLGKSWREEGGMADLSVVKRGQIIDELGDVLWYVAALASELGVELERVAAWNLEKLAARAEHGVDGWHEDRKLNEMKHNAARRPTFELNIRNQKPDAIVGEFDATSERGGEVAETELVDRYVGTKVFSPTDEQKSDAREHLRAERLKASDAMAEDPRTRLARCIGEDEPMFPKPKMDLP
jgi:NTP pyrophosphatase (non-canonical NTP hydrolase)